MKILEKKIFNDPVYGFISVPKGILLDLIDHRWMQRMSRIKQLGMSHYVYPGALHTRFHHALGALHLMQQALEVLRNKGVAITDEEFEGASIAILLHDIGHGPFSHALEHILVNVHHEEISILYMEQLDEEFGGKLNLARQIFSDQYPKKFLHQLVSGQLDMDRLDFLSRDSFFTGVAEGVVGYDRIIQMLAVQDGELVVEEKGIYSVEKFLIARRLMYWQVYLHKTVLAAEQMLIQTFRYAKKLAQSGFDLKLDESLSYFLYNNVTTEDIKLNKLAFLTKFSLLDDIDIIFSLKKLANTKDILLPLLSKGILDRHLFHVTLSKIPFERDYLEKIRLKAIQELNIPSVCVGYLVFDGIESNNAYDTQKDEIKIKYKNGKILPLSEASDYNLQQNKIIKHYICFPKNIL